jgi:hypothetical protein
MTTPAGWYDDGSGRQRWWDGEQWTEHFAPETPTPAAETLPAAEEAAHDAVIQPDTSSTPAADWAAPAIPPTETPAPAASEPPAYTPPGAAPSYPGTAPTYPGAAPTYPGNAPTHPGAYPGSVPGGYGAPAPYGSPGPYPGAAIDTAPKPMSVVGLVGLGLAALGTILVCIPATVVVGWILLAAGFVVSIVSLFLKGKKWPGITGVGVSVVGSIIGAIMIFVFIAIGISQAAIDIAKSAPTPSIGSDDGATDEPFGSGTVEEGTLGSPVTIEQMGGTSEVTITSATWSTSNGSSFEAENGGYLTIDLTWEGIEGTSSVNPLYFTVIDAEGNEGMYDIFSDAILESGDVAAGEIVQGTLSFDVAQSDSYTVIITDELLQDVAEVTVEATQG